MDFLINLPGWDFLSYSLPSSSFDFLTPVFLLGKQNESLPKDSQYTVTWEECHDTSSE